MYNVQNTRDNCFDVCVDFTFLGDGKNNGPPPECKIANCLLCDEQMSGPYFQAVAARSRRRSGLLSMIARSCDVILIVDHEPPCVTAQKKIAEGRRGRDLKPSATRITAPPQFIPPEDNGTCVFMNSPLGLSSYFVEEGGNFLPKFLLSDEEQEKISRYENCNAYRFNGGVLSGFWRNMKEIFGPAYNAAITMASLALILGIVVVICVWCSMCIASGLRFWKCMSVFSGLCGLFMLLTLSFFASDVCESGCEVGRAASTAIVSAIIWGLAAFSAYRSHPVNHEIPRAKCCCCPTIVAAKSSSHSHAARPTEEERKLVDEVHEEVNNCS
jgi:hypothetical protein